MTTNISGIAAPPATLQHTPWCDPSAHDDGATHTTPDPAWQICFSRPRSLEFGERGDAAANVEEITAELNFAHTDVWGERADILALVNVNGVTGLCLTPDQLAPIGHLFLSLDAEYRSETETADALMALAEAGVVEIEVNVEREERREAARRAWQEKAAKDEAARRKHAARVEAEGLVARCEQNLAEARQHLAKAEAAEVSAR